MLITIYKKSNYFKCSTNKLLHLFQYGKIFQKILIELEKMNLYVHVV